MRVDRNGIQECFTKIYKANWIMGKESSSIEKSNLIEET